MFAFEGLKESFFSDRKTKLLTLAVVLLIGLSLALYFGKKTDDSITELSPEEAYAFGNYMHCPQPRQTANLIII